MRELCVAIPDVDTFVSLEPEELGAKLLFVIRKHVLVEKAGQTTFHPVTLRNDFLKSQENQPTYPLNRMGEIAWALAEAFAWLEAQGLIIPAPEGTNAIHGWRIFSRRALKFEDESEFANYAAARRLQKDVLHPRLRDRAWSAFMRGEFDVAVFQAMKAVEVAVREAAELSASDYGPVLMRKAFEVDKGPLTDLVTERSEREALAHLFAGAIGTYKNSNSHRDVDLNDPIEAAEIVMFANHLLRIVDAREKARKAKV